nr:MAG TPA: Head protein [Caudoviricetes sp.]
MNLQSVLNTIRDNASDMYRDRIPEATQTNITEVQEAMCDPNNAVVTNEFMGMLLNLVIKQVIHSKLFSDPLKALKKGKKPLGDTVEEIYANFLKAKQYDPTGAELLSRELPDVKAVYHRMNRQDRYKVTVNPEQLFKAFASYDKLQSFIATIINSLYNSSELDEFVLMKQLIAQAIDQNAMVVVEVPDPCLSEQNAKAFIKTVKTVSGDMQFPNSNNNAWLTAQSTDQNPLITFSKKNEQVLILSNPTDVALNVDVLASVFNMSVAEFNDTRKIIIDAFPDPAIRGALVDEQFFQVFDDLVLFKDFENGEGLYKNYYLHIWQTLAYSPLVNAVVFRVGSDSDSDGQLETYTVTRTLATGVKSSNRRSKTEEGSSYYTKLSGILPKHTVTVTMGANNVTSSAYDEDTGEIEIETVTGNISITVAVTEYTITNTLASGVTNSNTATKVLKNASYEGTLTGITTETVAVTMGGETVTTDVYNSDTGKIEIEKVTGNIVITVS